MAALLNTASFKYTQMIHTKRKMVIVVETTHIFTICTNAHWTLPVFVHCIFMFINTYTFIPTCSWYCTFSLCFPSHPSMRKWGNIPLNSTIINVSTGHIFFLGHEGMVSLETGISFQSSIPHPLFCSVLCNQKHGKQNQRSGLSLNLFPLRFVPLASNLSL